MRLRSISVCIVLLCLCTAAFSFSAKKAYWIFFTDKGIASAAFVPDSDLYKKTKASLSPKVLSRGYTITLEDAPVNPQYVEGLLDLGIEPRSTSNWFNGVTALLSEDELRKVTALPFVEAVERVAVGIPQSPSRSVVFNDPVVDARQTPQALPIPCGYDTIIHHYGPSFSQLYRIGVPPLHAMGFDATAIKIGFMDTGFNHEGMRTTQNSKIAETFDFVFNDTVVADDAKDPIAADGHGSTVISAGIGYLPDSVIGPAYNAIAYLGKTEDLRSETPLEEGYYAQALEWLWSRGVDIASSSLGYLYYQAPYESLTYKSLDGKTTTAARAAIKAARRGMLVVTAAGNGGRDPFIPYIMTPGDADSIITVGGLFMNDSIGDFSSRGPTYDGRIKPEICAPGANVITVDRFDIIKGQGGTSLATPLVSSACALIMQAHPEASAQAIRKAVMKTGTRFGPPDTAYGYGRLNAYAAALELGTIISPHKQWRDDTTHFICVALAANNSLKDPKVMYSIGDSGAFTNSTPLTLVTDSLIYSATFPPIKRGKHVRYYIQTEDGADTLTLSPRNAPLAWYEFNVGDTLIKDTVPAFVKPGQVAESISVYPNPTSEKFTIISSYQEPINFRLVDLNGREVLAFTSRERTEVRLGTLPNGVYVLHGRLADGRFVTRQTIVRTQ